MRDMTLLPLLVCQSLPCLPPVWALWQLIQRLPRLSQAQPIQLSLLLLLNGRWPMLHWQFRHCSFL